MWLSLGVGNGGEQSGEGSVVCTMKNRVDNQHDQSCVHPPCLIAVLVVSTVGCVNCMYCGLYNRSLQRAEKVVSAMICVSG